MRSYKILEQMYQKLNFKISTPAGTWQRLMTNTKNMPCCWVLENSRPNFTHRPLLAIYRTGDALIIRN